MALLFAVAVTLAGVAWAEPAPGAAEGGFATQVEVEVVEVEVMVLGGDGRPVRGLEAEDFTVTVDGRSTPLSQFYRADGAAAPAPPEAPPDATDGMAAPPPRLSRPPLTVAVLVDDLSSLPSLRERAVEALGPFVAALPAGSQVTLARHEEEVEVILPLTADLKQAEAGLADLLARPTRGGRRRVAEQTTLQTLVHIHEMYLQSPQLVACGADEIDDLTLQAEILARERRIEAESALRAPVVVARALSAMEGRRVLLYLAGGVDAAPGRRAYDAIHRLCPGAETSTGIFEPSRRDLGPSIEKGVRALVGSGVTVFTLDVGGREAEPTMGADLPFNLQAPLGADLESRWSRQDVLFASAQDTGGSAFLDLDRPERIAGGIAEQLAAGYSLGFVPDHPAEGREHRLAVSVRGSGLEVRHRRSYHHATRAERAGAELRATLGSGGRLSVLGASVTVGRIAPRPAEKKRFDVSLWLRVPLRELLLTPGASGELTGNLHLYLTARDERDRESPMQAIDVPLSVPPGRVATGDLLYEIQAVMRPGQHRMALRVEDLRSGATDLLDFDVRIEPLRR